VSPPSEPSPVSAGPARTGHLSTRDVSLSWKPPLPYPDATAICATFALLQNRLPQPAMPTLLARQSAADADLTNVVANDAPRFADANRRPISIWLVLRRAHFGAGQLIVPPIKSRIRPVTPDFVVAKTYCRDRRAND